MSAPTVVRAVVPPSTPSAPLSDLLASLVGAWSLPSSFEQNGAHHGYRQVLVVDHGRLILPQFADIIAGFAPVWSAWMSWLDPGGYVVEHIDAGPHYERWQVPFTTAGTLYHDADAVPHEVGVPFRVLHHLWHSVRNDTDEPRISLVIDRDVLVSPTATPFRKG